MKSPERRLGDLGLGLGSGYTLQAAPFLRSVRRGWAGLAATLQRIIYGSAVLNKR
jgi:hypothetical protein